VNFESFIKTKVLRESIKKDFSSLASLGAEESFLETRDYKHIITLLHRLEQSKNHRRRRQKKLRTILDLLHHFRCC
jgi:hypothetical protein